MPLVVRIYIQLCIVSVLYIGALSDLVKVLQEIMKADLSQWEQAKVFFPSRFHHLLYLLIDNLLVFRLDYEEIVPLRCGDKFQPKPGCSVKSRAGKQMFVLFYVKRIVSPCLMLIINDA